MVCSVIVSSPCCSGGGIETSRAMGFAHLAAVLAGREQREDRDTPAVYPHLGVAHLTERA